jgi:ankyrin repeat protein
VPDDENALITASRRGRTEVVRLLIARGADVNRAVDGRTPLAMAQAGGHTRIATLLRGAGAMR